ELAPHGHPHGPVKTPRQRDHVSFHWRTHGKLPQKLGEHGQPFRARPEDHFPRRESQPGRVQLRTTSTYGYAVPGVLAERRRESSPPRARPAPPGSEGYSGNERAREAHRLPAARVGSENDLYWGSGDPRMGDGDLRRDRWGLF